MNRSKWIVSLVGLLQFLIDLKIIRFAGLLSTLPFLLRWWHIYKSCQRSYLLAQSNWIIKSPNELVNKSKKNEMVFFLFLFRMRPCLRQLIVAQRGTRCVFCLWWFPLMMTWWDWILPIYTLSPSRTSATAFIAFIINPQWPVIK